MNRFLQVISVFATAIGCGLYVVGDNILHVEASAVFRGLGAGFFVLGLLGLVVPMINARKK